MATIAAIAAGAAVSAAASAATKSAQGGAAGPSDRFRIPSVRERTLSREVEDAIAAQQNVITNNLGQFNNLAATTLFRDALGLVPQFEDNTAQLQELFSRRDALAQQHAQVFDTRAQMRQVRSRIHALSKRIDNLKGKKYKDLRDQLKAEREDLRSQKKELKLQPRGKSFQQGLTQQLALVDGQIAQLEAMPKRIIGFEEVGPDQLPPDSPLSSQNPVRQAFSLQNEKLIAALKGENEVDSRLSRQFADRERMLRDRLRRQLGPDYENSSAGIRAMNRFSTERDEAFEADRKDTIRTFSALTDQRARLLSGMVTDKLNQGVFLPRAGAGLSQALSSSIGNNLNMLAILQQNREQIGDATPGGGVSGGGITGSEIGDAALIGGVKGGLGEYLASPSTATPTTSDSAFTGG